MVKPSSPETRANLRSPFKESSKATVNLGGIAGSPSGEFQIEGLSLGKWQKVTKFHMKIISWNTRGLGSKKKRRVVKDFLRSEKPDVVMFQETKKEECDRRFVGSVWTARNKDWAALPACGASGGILIIWDAKKLSREEVVLGSFSVSIKFALNGCESLWLSAVYGPNNSALRKDFWVELSDIWAGFLRVDLPLRSASFTWSNMQVNPVCKRLDRFLYSNEWEQAFPQSIQGVLPRWTSDHWPIVLETNPFKWGPTPFRFENMWLQHPSFKENFGRWWREFQGNGWEGHKFMRKLQFVKAKLKVWNKASFGELKSIKEEILRYFEKLYTSPSGESWRVEGLDWSPISGESAFRLESPFTEEEIFKAIFQMDRDKAPGPDGFTIAVFQDCWEVIKEDLVKIIAKVLAGRIRGVLHETIHSTQGAFVQGRQILDAVLIANEIVDEKRRSGEEGVVFKIDFEKAYDHVSWDFLDHVLEMKGFGIRWRKWMRGCLSSVSFAVLVNGNAKGWVKASRGLRQGDPLSFLFTIVADVLSRMLLKAEERNVLEGFKVGRNRTRVSHLQFADDTIFFSSSREEDMMTLKNVLLVFGHISGLKVNLDKSNIYGINLEQNHLSRLAEMLDCKASGWPILYLVFLWEGILRRVAFGIL
ncbi:LINE-1 retrotransposable element ORF2 protein [Vitis vinifera]|uniref:LINE-1 retrotransposable element ORF2 protein n=1 Tax=Vitis vinifera TaxID=29760 RepID=A0A438DRE2_VITVI|nr:LINE-1 retrotransposable element ORF2 protein [Vitis vinifera]